MTTAIDEYNCLYIIGQSAPVQKYWAWESSKHKAALYTKLSTNTTELGECVYMDIGNHLFISLK